MGLLPGYDAWKLASPPGYDREPDCPACDDAGCPECCETAPITEDDLIEMEATDKFECAKRPIKTEAPMPLHPETFNYLQPTRSQTNRMTTVRDRFAVFARELSELLPEGPDKTYILRGLRSLAMWANVTITRTADGAPRED